MSTTVDFNGVLNVTNIIPSHSNVNISWSTSGFSPSSTLKIWTSTDGVSWSQGAVTTVGALNSILNLYPTNSYTVAVNSTSSSNINWTLTTDDTRTLQYTISPVGQVVIAYGSGNFSGGSQTINSAVTGVPTGTSKAVISITDGFNILCNFNFTIILA